MRAFQTTAVRVVFGGLVVLGAAALSAQRPSYPADIDPESGNRLPIVKRADLDEYGKKVFDDNLAPGRTTLLGGPVGLRMYVPEIADHLHATNQFLRNKAGLPPRLVELVILATTRELNAQYEWSGHEPAALRVGLEPEIIDIVKSRRDVTGLGEKEAAIIQLVRETLGKRKVSSETFARARKTIGERGLIVIGGLMGEYSAASVLLTMTDQQLRPDQKPLLPIP